jgi:hypothetical protein
VENVHQCIGPEPALYVSKKAEHKEKDHVLAWQLAYDNWHGLTSTQRQAQELISGPKSCCYDQNTVLL